MQKIICYVDGYNLFHQIKDDPSANINLQALAESLVAKSKGENKLVMVHYFSAFASWKNLLHIKHRRYVNRLAKTGVDITMAYFSKSPAQCRNCKTQWTTHEEKQTDVNIALQILEDAYDDKYDIAFIMSGDSDIVPAIEAVRKRFPEKKFLAVLPRLQANKSRAIVSATDSIVYLSNGRIKKHQFPE